MRCGERLSIGRAAVSAVVLSFVLLATVGTGGATSDGIDDIADVSSLAYGIQSGTVSSEPTGLTAISGVRRVALYWDPPLNDGGSPIVSYKVYRGGPSATVPSEYQFLRIVQVEAYMDYSVEGNRVYYYRVTAVNGLGEGPASDSISATPAPTPYQGYDYVPPIEPEGGLPTIAGVAVVIALMGLVLFFLFSRE